MRDEAACAAKLDVTQPKGDGLASAGSAARGANLEISVEAIDGHLRVTPTGEVDLSTAEQLEHRLLQMLGNGSERLVVDLSQLYFIDVAGLRVLMGCRDRAAKTTVAFQVIPGRGQPRRILELCGLIERLDTTG